MPYSIQAALGFSTTTVRTSARNTINAALTGKTRTEADYFVDQATKGQNRLRRATSIGIRFMFATQADADAMYTTISGLTSPMVGSRVWQHECIAGQACTIGREKVW